MRLEDMIKNYANKARRLIGGIAVIGAGLFTVGVVHAADTTEKLHCQIGFSSRWGASWCDLKSPMDFPSGTTIEISIDPNGAQVVLVRFLGKDDDPNEPLGIVNGKQPVKNGKILLTLDHDYINIKQISVHGGPGPWNHDLGENNKGAIIQSISTSSSR